MKKIVSLLLVLLMVVGLAACSANVEVSEPEKTAEETSVSENIAEAPAPPAEENVSTGTGAYAIGLIRDDVAKAELNIPSGKVVDIALNYAGKDSTVDFEVTGNTDESVATASADVLTLTISGAKAGSTTITASWTAVNTSGSTYTVEIAVNVNDDGTESFTELTVGDAAASGESGGSSSGSGEPAPIGGSGEMGSKADSQASATH